MKNKICFGIFALLILMSGPVNSWNLAAKHVNALIFDKNGHIKFTLFNESAGGDEYRCSTKANGQWFNITACNNADSQCIASVDRMASMLLAAKVAGKPVHVQVDNCTVTEVALKP